MKTKLFPSLTIYLNFFEIVGLVKFFIKYFENKNIPQSDNLFENF